MSFSNALVPFSPGRIPAGFKSLPHLTASNYNRSLINNLQSSSIIFFLKIRNPLLGLKLLASLEEEQPWAAADLNSGGCEQSSSCGRMDQRRATYPGDMDDDAKHRDIQGAAVAAPCICICAVAFNSFSFSANQMLILSAFFPVDWIIEYETFDKLKKF
jgi:hypothetical protein